MTLDEILAKVSAETTAESAMAALLMGVQQQLRDTNGNARKLQDVADAIDADIAKVNEALSKHLPAPITAPPTFVVIAAANPNATPLSVLAVASDHEISHPNIAEAANKPDASPASVALAISAAMAPATKDAPASAPSSDEPAAAPEPTANASSVDQPTKDPSSSI